MKRLLKVTAMTGLLTLFKMAMGFVIAKVVAIYTGPTGMAMLGQVQSMVISLNGIINAPVSSGLVRYTAEKHGEGFESCAPWWRASLQWVLIISAIIIPTGLLLAEHLAIWLFQNESLAWIVMVTVAVLPFSAVGTLCNSVINGQQQYRRYVSLGMLSAFVSGAVMLVLIIKTNITGALLATAVQASLIGLIMLVANLRQPWFRLCYWWGSTDRQARKAIGGYMLMAMTTALTVPISLIVVRNILIGQLGWEAAGQWQAVWKISEVYLGVITMALGTYYLPRLSSLASIDSIIYEANHTARVVLPIVAILALAIYLLRDVAIWALFTKDFSAARDLFAIQLCGDFIKIASWIYAYPMLSRGNIKWFVSTEVFFAMLFIILSYVFVGMLDLLGVTVAYFLNYTIYFIVIRLNLHRII